MPGFSSNGTGGHGERYSRLRHQAIAVLLEVPVIRAAAERLGIAECTLRRWLRKPAFMRSYRKARLAVVEESASCLQQSMRQAAETLRHNLTCGNPTAEITAATRILELGMRAQELTDFAERLAEMERRQAQGGKP